MPKLNIYGLGSAGVNVDKSPLQLDDNELTKAQNAVPSLGSKGGIKKRPPLVKFDTDVAAGSIPGFIGAPLGPGPGAGSDDQTAYYAANAAGTWFRSVDSYATSAAVSTLSAETSTTLKSVRLDGRLYYAVGATIRVFDGIKDSLFTTLTGYTINQLGVFDGRLYATTTISTTGTVFEIDDAGRVRQIGAVLTSNFLPQAICLHQNDLFVTCFKAATLSTVYRIRLATATATTAWTLDYTETIVLVDGLSDFNDLISYNGLLYLTGGLSSGAGGTAVYQRSAAGVWTPLVVGLHVNAVGMSFAVFKGVLYEAVYKGNATDGDLNVVYSSANWVQNPPVLVDATTSPPRTGKLYVAENKLFYLQPGRSYLHYTTDGTSWTKVTTASAVAAAFGFFRSAGGTGAAGGATSSFVLLQGGSSLQIFNQAGTLTTQTLPTGITLDASRPPRFAIVDRFILMVNTPSRPITIDAAGIVRVLSPLPPNFALTLDDDGGAGALTGEYQAWQTFLIRDADGSILAESDYGPDMDVPFTAAADTLDAEGVNLSLDGGVTDSQIYRSTNGGAVKFRWIVVNGNTLTQSVSDDTVDAALSTVAGPTLGTCPNLALVASWKGRVWGVDRAAVDDLRFSEAGVMYAWPSSNGLLVGRRGADARGITALLPRRDALGVGRREGLFQVTGTTNANYNVITLSEHCGVESQETVKVWRDVAYFLWKDGVYRWGPSGIDCISDGKARSWFNTDLYFNRARFPYAFAGIDPIQNKYRLFLAALESSVEDRWVEYDLSDGTWWGPHKTGAFTTLTSAGGTADSGDRYIPLIASSDGYLWKPGTVAGTDDTATAIDFDVDTKRHDGLTPDIEKNWGQLSVLSKAQAAGALTITPYIGALNAAAGTALTADMTKGREKLPRLGVGKHAGFNLRQNVVAQDVDLYGYEIPFYELGRR